MLRNREREDQISAHIIQESPNLSQFTNLNVEIKMKKRVERD